MADKADQLVMEAFCATMAAHVGRQIQDALKAEGMHKEIGFALITFDFGEGGSIAYASNADRADFLRAFDEMRGKLAASLPAEAQARTQ